MILATYGVSLGWKYANIASLINQNKQRFLGLLANNPTTKSIQRQTDN
jgi:hypothetical protein